MLYQFLRGEISLDEYVQPILDERSRSRSEEKAIFAKGRAGRGTSIWYNPNSYLLNYKKVKTSWIKTSAGKKVARRELSGPTITQDGKKITNPGLIKKIMALPFRKDLTEVRISPNLKGPILAIGIDAKGKKQYAYSQESVGKSTQSKFKRVQGFAGKIGEIRKAIKEGLTSKDPTHRETSLAMALVDATGIRVGTEGTDAIGCTTLLAKNVKISGSSVRLSFTGKSGKAGNYTISDSSVANAMKKALAGKSPKDFVFPNISAANVNGFLRYFGRFTAKDFRTHIASQEAFTMAKSFAKKLGKKPSQKALRSAYGTILATVATRLNNTPAIARDSYINPISFAPLQEIGLKI